ncbi:MAG: putative metal-dependent phosphoesterase TrpH, partial [Thalassolituus oleivorans]
AFNKYLGAGKPGDVKASWPELAQVTEWIVAAGGTAVMAHAHLYKMTRTKLKACLQDFKDAGGQGLEVAYGNMDANQLGQMSALAREMDLLGSCGSDFHGPNRFGLDLGVMPAFPKDVTPVWASWS